VLETSWWSPEGWTVVIDALPLGSWHHEHERSTTHRRAPTDYDADHVLLSLVRCVNGEVQIRLDCGPVFDYGRVRARWEYTGAGYREAVAQRRRIRSGAAAHDGAERRLRGSRAIARTLVKQGERRFVAFP
jgi:alpha,alpha-trehalase